MLDRGLLLSGGAVLVVLFLLGRTRRSDEPALSEAAFWPVVAGLVAGRLVALALDDPVSLRTGRNLLLLRGGVELWPGVAVGALTAVALLRHHRQAIHPTIVLLVPAGVAAWATYDLACLVRDGCPGPATSFGLRPPGLTTTQLPIGLLVGLIGLTAAVSLRRLSASHSNSFVLLAGLLVVSALRSVESIWLPSLTEGTTRQTAQSLGVLACTLLATVAVARRRVTGDAPIEREDPAPPVSPGDQASSAVRDESPQAPQPTEP